jgi:ribonuclease R
MYAFLREQLESGKPQVYPGLVIDVRNFGFFVDVSGLAMSGLVHLSSIADDFFIFDEARGQLTGRRTRRVIRLGDRVEVQIAKVDSFKKQVDFRLAQTGKVQRDDRRDDRHQPLRPRQNARPSFKPSTQAGGNQGFKSGPRHSGGQGPRHGGGNNQRPGANQSRRPNAGQGPRPGGNQGSRPGASNSQRPGSKPESQRPQIPSSHSQRKFGGQGGRGGQRRRRR